MVILYNRLGERFAFSQIRWSKLLESAHRHGWAPKGTSPPPRGWDLDAGPVTFTWDGNYSRPVGQSVQADDSLGLASAIERSLAAGTEHPSTKERLLSFAAFCRQRGFVVLSQRPSGKDWETAERNSRLFKNSPPMAGVPPVSARTSL
jgi:hypothetical protein